MRLDRIKKAQGATLEEVCRATRAAIDQEDA